jgi:glycerol-3-phosphate acyltransferase PlsX
VPDLRSLRRPAGARRLSGPLNAPAASARVAVDLLGVPDSAITHALQVAAGHPGLSLLLVGAQDQLGRLVSDPEVRIVPASDRIQAADDPVRAVRSRRGASVRLAARLVRDGEADGFVSFGPPAATIAAAQFTLGRLPGVTRPALAAVLSTPGGPAVLLDTGAGPDASPDALVQHALTGVAYVRARFDSPEPAVGLLSAGFPPGSGDPSHDEAHQLLASVSLSAAGPVRYVGTVDVTAVLAGGVADVIVTDGFTGKVLLAALPPADVGGAALLGVDGVVVAGAGSTPEAVAAGIRSAADAVHSGLVAQLGSEMDALVARRREAAGREHAI